jgi:hypothetical protein
VLVATGIGNIAATPTQVSHNARATDHAGSSSSWSCDLWRHRRPTSARTPRLRGHGALTGPARPGPPSSRRPPAG